MFRLIKQLLCKHKTTKRKQSVTSEIDTGFGKIILSQKKLIIDEMYCVSCGKKLNVTYYWE